jgi:hypothetical protein
MTCSSMVARGRGMLAFVPQVPSIRVTIDNNDMKSLTIVIPSARGRAGPAGASIELKAGVAVCPYQWAERHRYVFCSVVRAVQSERGQLGEQRHCEAAGASDQGTAASQG